MIDIGKSRCLLRSVVTFAAVQVLDYLCFSFSRLVCFALPRASPEDLVYRVAVHVSHNEVWRVGCQLRSWPHHLAAF
ncbi:hypothetical protein TNCV_4489391 [Trichonephila clavipes]|nr:hypothetical protein TNCV_4489391 [Trichonephila clavipes]